MKREVRRFLFGAGFVNHLIDRRLTKWTLRCLSEPACDTDVVEVAVFAWKRLARLGDGVETDNAALDGLFLTR